MSGLLLTRSTALQNEQLGDVQSRVVKLLLIAIFECKFGTSTILIMCLNITYNEEEISIDIAIPTTNLSSNAQT